MKNLITLLFLAFCFSGFSQNLDGLFERFPLLIPNNKVESEKVQLRGPEDIVKDSTYFYYFESDIGDYDLKDRTIYDYNDEGKIVLESVFRWENNDQVFTNKSKRHYLYDVENRLIEEWTESYYDTLWFNGSKTVSVYENDRLVEEKYQNWNYDTGEWEDNERILISYNNEGLRSEVIYQLWNPNLVIFGNYARLLYTYNDNDLVEVFQNDIWGYFDSWVPWEKYQYTYDAEGNNILTQSIYWDGYDWYLSQQDLMSYNNQNFLTESISQSWDIDSMDWKNVYKYSYEYDASNNLLMYLSEYFASEWKLLSRTEFSYDSNSNNTQQLNYSWESFYEPIGWNPTFRYDHYWSELPSSSVESISNKIECAYPNPFIQGNEINCVLENGEDYEFSIIDMQGRVLYHTNISGNTSLGLDENLPTGMYFLTIHNEGDIVYRDKLIMH